jgi:hypothetical protein
VLVGDDILEITIVLAGAHIVLRIRIFEVPGMRQLSPQYMADRSSPPHPNDNFNQTISGMLRNGFFLVRSINGTRSEIPKTGCCETGRSYVSSSLWPHLSLSGKS